MTYSGPAFARAHVLIDQIEEVRRELEEAKAAGMFSRAADLLDDIHETEHALFLTGYRLETDQ